MPLLRSSVHGGQACREQKRSDSSNKPCRTVEKVDWAMRRCRCRGLPLKKVKSAEKQKRSDTSNKPCKVKRAEKQKRSDSSNKPCRALRKII